MPNVYSDVIKGVPNYTSYLTVDELDKNSQKLMAEFPDKVKYYQYGVARNGEPIKVLKIGDGKLNALLYGFPHSNEAVGSLTIDYFARVLAEDDDLRGSLGFTWYLIKVIDPVGARRNEGWFSNPMDMVKKKLKVFRWPANEIVEGTFPVTYKTYRWDHPPPETRTLVRLLYDVKFDFINCLQDQGAGGVLYTVSHPCSELYPIYQEIALKDYLQLHHTGGDWYAGGMYQKLARGIYIHGTFETIYDYIDNRDRMIATENRAPLIGSYIPRGTNPEDYMRKEGFCGNSIFGFVKTVNPNAFVFQCEVARGLFNADDSKYYSVEESDITLADVSLKLLALEEKLTNSVEETYHKAKNYLTSSSVEAMDTQLKKKREIIEGGRKEAEIDPLLEKKATWGEKFAITSEKEFYALRRFGEFYAILAQRYWQRDSYKAKLEPLMDETMMKLEQWDDRTKKTGYKTIPLKKLVECQVSTNLVTADYIRENLSQ